MNRAIFSIKNLLFAVCIVFALVGGLAFGLHIGYTGGSIRTTEIRNQMLDLKPYDASLPIKDLEYSEISPSGVTITFNTDSKVYGERHYQDLSCEWTIYPSDIFTITKVQHILLTHYLYKMVIDTYPEGGTLMFRILEDNLEDNRGSLWFYIDLPHSDDSNAILPPPYIPKETRK